MNLFDPKRDPKFVRFAERIVRTKPNLVLSGSQDIYSSDPRFIRFLLNATEQATLELPSESDELGFLLGAFVPDNFYSGRTLGGFAPSAMSFPPLHNRALRKELKLSEGLDSTELSTFKRLHELMFRKVPLSNLRLSTKASTMAPHFITDVETRKEIAKYAFKHFRRVLSLVAARDLSGLDRDFGMLPCYALVSRRQCDTVKDGVSKERLINTKEVALRGGGERIPMDKRVFIDGALVPDVWTPVVRTAYGANGPVNYFLQAPFVCFREHYLNTYSFTFKHRGADDIRGKISRFPYIIVVDVKNYDQSAPEELLRLFVDEMDLDETYKTLLRTLMFAPYFYSGMERDTQDSGWSLGTNELINLWDHPSVYGIPSGACFNPDLGKFCNVGALIAAAERFLRRKLDIHQVLGGSDESFALLNAGDDAIIMTREKAVFDHFSQLGDKDKAKRVSNLFRYQIEPGRFLGFVVGKDTRCGETVVYPNLTSVLPNYWCHEFSWSDPRRVAPASGYYDRISYFAKHPYWPTLSEIINKCFFDQFKCTPESVIGPPPEHFDTLNPADRLVQAKPEAIHYLVDPEELSPWFATEITSVIEPIHFTSFINAIT